MSVRPSGKAHVSVHNQLKKKKTQNKDFKQWSLQKSQLRKAQVHSATVQALTQSQMTAFSGLTKQKLLEH